MRQTLVLALVGPLLVALAATLSACGGQLREVPEPSPLVWPAPPDTPRIAFVRAFSRPAELGIGRGLAERLQALLLGDRDTRMVRPMAVAVVRGVIYVADPGVQAVHRFDPAGDRYALVRGPGGTPLPSPVGLAEGAGGEVYVTDSRLGGVFVIRPDAEAAAPLALDTAPRQPTGIAFDPDGRRLLVVDTAAHQILAYGPDLRLMARIGTGGNGPGEFNHPTALWRDPSGRLYVTDPLNFRIQILDADGTFLAAIGRAGDSPGDSPRPKGVATDRDGHVFVVDALLHSVQIFDEAGRFLLPVGQQGQDRGEFWLPAGVFVSGDGHIYVADSYNRRVQVLRYIGGPT